MKLSQGTRVLNILYELIKQQEVCTDRLSEVLNENLRTIQRDLKIIKDFFNDDLVQTKRGCYKLINGNIFNTLYTTEFEKKHFENFIDFLAILDDNITSFLDSKHFDFLKKLKDNQSKLYTFFDNPVEILKCPFFDDMKKAIKYKRYCNLVYHEHKRRDLKDVKPHRILYAQNNWYLACMTKNYKLNGGFKLFRINHIVDFQVLNRQFNHDIEVLNHIKNMQSLFENFKGEKYKVKLRAQPNIARYFKNKKYLKTQVIHENEDGSLDIEYEINSDMEVLPLIKRWIPDLKVIEPKELDEVIKEEIKRYLNE